ncbi:MAG: family 10 glycosylhydrolase [Melioribacteraceae bacterium]
MRKFYCLVGLLLILQTVVVFPQSLNPKREFRGAWIATVTNIDWPVRGASTSSQKQDLIRILDGLKQVNVNAVMFQVRPECDALYNSAIEPWSHWLTGVQGKAPNPFYDPLLFAIEEAHKRGMELHAWFNPYRVERVSGNYNTASNHVSKKHPEWIITKVTQTTPTKVEAKILDPGLPQVRNYVLSVIMDVVKRYDIDAVHFDDYFYLDGMGTEDEKTYETYGGFTSLADWRRDNVNTLVQMISDSIKAVKPNVKWGISPRGIWRPGYPAGITGNDNYNSIYCDAMAWLRTQTIDYINPQLYWAFGGGQDYGKLMPWWADSAGVHSRHMYVGHAVYRINNPFSANEVPRQIRLNRTDKDCQGSVLYNTTSTLNNLLGFYDSLKTLYKYPALLPNMSWKDQVKPNIPINLRWGKLAGVRNDGLIWETPTKASDGENASMYVVYKFISSSVQPADIENAANLYNIVGTTSTPLKTSDNTAGKTMYFAVSSLDRNYNESGISNVVSVQINVPNKPLQIFPADLAVNQKDTIKFVWENTPHSTSNRFVLATDINFTNIIVHQLNIVDTFKTVIGLKGQTTYYWKITASNPTGESVYSDVRSFTTGFPIPPQLVLPVDKSIDVVLVPTLVWKKEKIADKYRLLVADGTSILPSITIVDTILADTTVTLKKLSENTTYTWSVMALNQYGKSGLAEPFKFKTLTSSGVGDETVPVAFVLNQNYPNPFNPTTQISFSIAESGVTVLRIYNLLGQNVAELLRKNLSAGSYSVEFNAGNLPSGVYIYVLRAGSKISSKKMIFIK